MEEEKKLTGYPSIDKPWLKYYTEEAINAPLPECSIYEYLWKNNKEHLNGIALNYFGTKITFSELFRRIDETAKAFVSIGVKPQDTVTIVSLSCVSSVLCLYALNRIGAVSNYINVLASEDELSSYISDAESKVVITMDLFAEKTVRAAQRVGVSMVISFSLSDDMPFIAKNLVRLKLRNKVNISGTVLWNEFLKNSSKSVPLSYRKSPKELCYLAHTGGTTGFPKSVLLNDNSFNAVTQNYVISMPHNRGEVFLSMMIPYVVYGTLVNIHMPLCLGLETVLIPKFEPADWSKYIKKYHPNHCCSIPAYIAPMVENKALAHMDLSEIKTVGLGGDGLNVELEEKLNTFFESHHSTVKVLAGYGMTEVCATSALAFAHARKIGSVGIPLVKNNVMIYSEEADTELPYGKQGEVCLNCVSEMMGYKDNPEETKKLLRTHKDGKTWLHTGDIGYVDKDGFLFICGRMKRMIMTVIDGAVYKVFPSNIENVLSKHDYVKDICVIPADDGMNKVLKAFVVLDGIDNHRIAEKALRDYCDNNLAENMRPRFYEFIDILPLTPVGKVDYRALEKEAE